MERDSPKMAARVVFDLWGSRSSRTPKGPLVLFCQHRGRSDEFEPGSGFLAPPELTHHGALYILSNRGVLYGFAQ